MKDIVPSPNRGVPAAQLNRQATTKSMRSVAAILFILVGIVNLLPLVGVLGAERLESLYGLSFPGQDLLLLMRHRAVLFGVLGAFIIFAGFRAQARAAAAVAGLVSMLSFMVLALPLSAHSEELQRVFWMDAAACCLLVVGYWVSFRYSRMAANASLERTGEK